MGTVAQTCPAVQMHLAAGLPSDQKLDAIVIDEAQDFAPLWWKSLLASLRDPEGGEIYAFMDERQNVYGRWDSQSAGTALDPTANLVTLHIDENLRNTKRIAQTFKGFAGKHFAPRGGDGLPVRLVPSSTDDAIDVAGDCVDALIDEGWANNQIAFLTTKNRHSIHKEFENDPVGYWKAFHDDDGEFYGHVLGFKGLERSVVILCVNGFKDMSRAAELLYVGLSRARCLLVVVGDPNLIAEAGGPELARAMSSAQHWQPDLAAENA